MRVFLSGLCLSLALAGAAGAQTRSPDLSQLHDDLRLTAEQAGAWRAYEATMSQNNEIQARRQATAELLPRLATPRRLALIDSAMAQDLADFRRQSQAVAAFYDRLTPEQQRIFDMETLPPPAGADLRQDPPEQNGSRPILRMPPP